MAKADADRSLLFGILALQNGLIDQDALIAAFQAWSRDRARTIDRLLVERGALAEEDRAALEVLVRGHLRRYGDDAERSLAAINMRPGIRRALEGMDDADLHATLSRVSAKDSSGPDLEATTTWGLAPAEGQRFRILRPHAEGGLGAVFVALDGELHREVALKQIQDRYADDAQSRARFLLEAEITGGLEHSGIVPVYSLGADAEGRPYYAMRFIRGDSLKEAIVQFHADDTSNREPGARGLELRKLLRRFLDVCNAIAYAHSRGVLHRDLKPGNVIVGRHGETLVVDWGLAKAVGRADPGPSAGERTLVPASASGQAETLPGSALGTPAYMSPEQAAGDVERLGPRSDVYSLGGMLYCLLTGKPAFDQAEVGNVLRAVQKGEFPRPRALDSSIDPALEAVCLKAMALEPQDRYETPLALSEDIERWMADEPVSARREPWTAQARRWTRRHRAFVTTAAALLITCSIALSVGLVLLGAKQRETDAARREADLNFRKAVAAVDQMLVRVSQKHLANLPHFEPVRRQLLEDALSFYQDFLRRRGNDPSLILLSARAYRHMGEISLLLNRRDRAREHLDRGLALLDRLTSIKNVEADRAFEGAFLYVALGNLGWEERRFTDAIEDFDRALHLFEQALPHARNRGIIEQEVAACLDRRGSMLVRLGRTKEAHEAFRRATAIQQRLAAAQPFDDGLQYQMAAVQHNSADLSMSEGAYEEAVRSYGRSGEILEQLLLRSPGEVHYRVDLEHSVMRLVEPMLKLSRYSEAERAAQRAVDLARALSADFPSVPNYRFELAATYHALGNLEQAMMKYDTAEIAFGHSVEILKELIRQDPESPAILRDLGNSEMCLGNALGEAGRIREALAAMTRSRDHFQAALRLRPGLPDHLVQLAAVEHNRGELLRKEHDLGAAEQAFRRSAQILSELIANHRDNAGYRRDLASSRTAVGRTLRERGDATGADKEWGLALTLWRELDRKSPGLLDYQEGLGLTLAVSGQPEEAARVADALAAIADQNGRNFYTAACILALCASREKPPADANPSAPTFADRAMRCLEQAVDHGVTSRAKIEGDSDLDSLRARDDYRKLLGRLK